MSHRLPAGTLALTILLAGAGTAFGQTPASPEPPGLAAAATAAAQAIPLQPPPAKRGRNPVAIGALIGAVGAAAMTAVAARRYGHNEGYGTCVPCLVQWGTIAVPVGAGIGAGIGWAVKAGSPDPQPISPPAPADRTAQAGWRRDAAVTIRF
jgi:hypothetical protein